ncbi:DUF3572 domain-containing protein [Aurantimonas sp. VKM B-3413]|uniref:DUF3572 domain-containing protein n=1 Tax=Aurantimonas sp. VKM B-3413 TaxID=2779401 RepID=UPI001E5A8FD8|nr:DUF3572 domain-containing protein [Aurantimonas sp. VKM B-3413]MCB8838483.1 DUF3572 domain-containing protein [Aurantimonas sp. VKM B-3413]
MRSVNDKIAAGSARRSRGVDQSTAKDLAISALGFIASDRVLLDRFLALTGLSVAELRQAAASAGFLPGVLDFILGHEPTLLAFAQASNTPPERIGEARRALARPGEESGE